MVQLMSLPPHLVSLKSRVVLSFWFQLTQVVLKEVSKQSSIGVTTHLIHSFVKCHVVV